MDFGNIKRRKFPKESPISDAKRKKKHKRNKNVQHLFGVRYYKSNPCGLLKFNSNKISDVKIQGDLYAEKWLMLLYNVHCTKYRMNCFVFFLFGHRWNLFVVLEKHFFGWRGGIACGSGLTCKMMTLTCKAATVNVASVL